ncbi:MAG TPA: hypothetical protein VGG39_35840 [Polyangiaceae bacterium]
MALLRRAMQRAEADTALRLDVTDTQAAAGMKPFARPTDETHDGGRLPPVTRLELGWDSVGGSSGFPAVRVELSAWPLSATETQLEIAAEYGPAPSGPGVDATDPVGHASLREASIRRFVAGVVEQLRAELH